MDTSAFTPIQNQIVEVLKSIYDPEMPVNIWDMGLIYDIKADENNNVNILMTLTVPNCPVAESLPIEVKNKVMAVPHVSSVNVDITFDPIWDMDMMSDEAKLQLDFLF